MAPLSSTYTEKFRFVSRELPPEHFKVIRFSGTEGIHRLFSFTIDLVSKDNEIDTDKLLHAPASLSIFRDEGEPAVFNGYPSRVEQGGTFNGYAYYTVELRPSFWKLTQIVQSRIFLEENLQETLKELLISQKFFAFANEFRLMRSDYPKPEFAMQYEESLYNYICWRLEEQGAYYFITQKSGFDTLVFGDSPQSHTPLPTPTLYYSPATGLEGIHVPEVITSFTLRQTPVPRQVVIRSYDWKNPSKPVVGIASVSPAGLGDVYLTNENVNTDASAARLAKIRAEQLLAEQRQYHGQSAVPTLRPGYTFTLDRHYSKPFNRKYLVTSVTHEGSQEAFLSLGLSIPMHGVTDHHFYRNTFTCIHDDTVFRPARTAPRNKISGIIRAFIDGASLGARPEMDGYGRYKLLFPFDISGRKKGKASCWVRMAQQQVGNNSGASFPLLPGTEVTVGFLDGNPDLPIITGALANGETGARTGGGNANASGIRTAGGNQITFNDTNTHQGIAMTMPSGQGMTFSSGSLSSGQQNTDMWLSSSTTFGTELAGIGKSIATGFKVSESVGPSDAATIALLVTKALSKSTESILSSLSSKASDLEGGDKVTKKWEFQFGADGVKILGQLIDIIISGCKSSGKDAPSYGASLSASETSGDMKIQVLPEKKEIVASLVTWLLGRVASSGTSIAQGVVDANATDKAGSDYLQALNSARNALFNLNHVRYSNYSTDITTEASLHCANKTTVISQIEEELGVLSPASSQLNNYGTYTASLYKSVANKVMLKNEITKLEADLKEKELGNLPTELIKNKAIDPLVNDLKKTLANKKEILAQWPAQTEALRASREKIIALAEAVMGKKRGTTDEEIITLIADAQSKVSESIKPLETAKSELASAWKIFCDEDPDNDEYYVNVRNKAIHTALVSSTSDLIPELTSFILLYIATHKYPRKFARLGGVSLKSNDSNININAKLPVSVCSDEGILINTKTNLGDATAVPPAQADPTAERLAGKTKNFADWGRPGGLHLKNKVIPPALAPDQLYPEWKDFIAVTDNEFTDSTNAKLTAANFRTNNTFAATFTDLAYTEAAYGKELFAREHFASAGKHVIKSNSASLTLSETEGNPAVSGGVTLTVRNPSAGQPKSADASQILLNFGGDEAAKDFSRVLLNKTSASMIFEPDSTDDKAQIALKQHSGEMSAGSQKGTVNVSNSEAAMGFGTSSAVICSDNKVAVKGDTIVLGKFTIAGTEIKGTEAGVLDFVGGAIKITGGAVQGNVQSLQKKVEDNQKAISEALKKANEAIKKQAEELKKLNDALAASQAALAKENAKKPKRRHHK